MPRNIEQGTIKIVWLEDTAEKIFSKMFDTEEEALDFAKETNKRDFMIFRLIEQEDMEEFSWEILPYGRFELYSKLFSLYRKGKLLRFL